MKLFQLIGAIISCITKVAFAILKLVLTIVFAPFYLIFGAVPFMWGNQKLKKMGNKNDDFDADDYYEKLLKRKEGN